MCSFRFFFITGAFSGLVSIAFGGGEGAFASWICLSFSLFAIACDAARRDLFGGAAGCDEAAESVVVVVRGVGVLGGGGVELVLSVKRGLSVAGVFSFRFLLFRGAYWSLSCGISSMLFLVERVGDVKRRFFRFNVGLFGLDMIKS